jgi:3'(2'), 5'-bisphosphate nucleotidase
MDLSKELSTAIELAHRAGDAILEIYGQDFTAEEKIGADDFAEPVTEADRMASRLIVEGLSKEFSRDAILSEEEMDDPDGRLQKSRTWMIDPIDGTLGFIRRDGDFAVQIGLAENGTPILGVVHLPFFGETLFAAKGCGAHVRRNGSDEKLNVSELVDLQSATLASSRNHRSVKMNRVVETFGLRNEVQRGSVGLKIGLIASRETDIYIHLSPRTKYWDTCAPQAIIEEAGGTMTDLFGEPLRYDSSDVRNLNGIVASNGMIHQETLKKLKPLLTEFGRLRVIV